MRTSIGWRRPDKLIVLLRNNITRVQTNEQSSYLRQIRERLESMMMSTKTRCFLVCLALVLIVQAQDQSGFISLDCGLPANSSYTESTTNITYISDAAYINSGENKSIDLNKSSYEQQLWSLRSFPEGIRNCYSISNITGGTKYLIRASFLYGNYDGRRYLPIFDLYFGDSLWDTVNITLDAFKFYYEVIHVPPANRVQICLINIGAGIPFISALEFRPLPNDTYPIESGSLSFFARLDVGSTSNISHRFPYDVYDRIWSPSNNDQYFDRLSTSLIVDVDHTEYQPAAVVMETTIIPKNASRPFSLSWGSTDENTQFYVYLYFAELVKLQSKQFRGFNISHNGKYWKGPVIPDYLYTISIYDIKPLEFPETQHNLSFTRIENSTLPPILNAAEIYTNIEISELESDQGDVDAIRKIKSTYGVIKDWEGDPCIPTAYPWSGVGCSNESTPRIISLNLSSSGLTGDISPDISNLTALQTLDLSNNSLTGKVPDSLSKLSNLEVLNLENNNLSCPIPLELIRRSNDSSLSLSVKGNPNLECTEEKEMGMEKEKKKNNFVIPVVASVGGLLVIIIIAGIVFWIARPKRKQQEKDVLEMDHPETNIDVGGSSLETRRRQFTYSEVVRMTNNFERILGRGSFGAVYHGLVDDIQVAVKMLAPSAIQGQDQFKAEVTVLLKVHHRNLTNLIGYLNEGTHLGLIHEYMANGSLAQRLSGISVRVISWEDRLRIAMDAAQGLKYLHDGCKPPIVHGDMKPTNILLTENFQAKLSDFGLSKSYPADDKTGYLDPEYKTSNRLSAKSDVYSFGLVLLEIVSCRPVISKSQRQDSVHIVKWVGSMIAQGDIRNIADPRLKGEYNINSVRKAVELAMACVLVNSDRRPTISQVVAELNACLATELSRTPDSHPPDSTDTIEMTSIYMVLPAQSGPMAR